MGTPTTAIHLLSDVVGVRSRFGRSINLERNFYEEISLDGYVLTTTGLKSLRQMARSLADPLSPRAWTLTGVYGSGKSAFALFAAKAMSASSPDVLKARDLIKEKDKELWGSLFDRRRKTAIAEEGLLPILISGSREPLVPALLRGVVTGIEKQWRGKTPPTLAKAKSMLRASTDGEPVGGKEIIGLLSELMEQARFGWAGVLIVVDELGKLLEYAAAHSDESDIFALQELAEATRRNTSRPLFLMTILHQAFDRYAERLGRAQKDEWMKVQGRFEDVPFQEPPDQVLRIIGEAIDHNGPRLC